jgi:hypothetical protein
VQFLAGFIDHADWPVERICEEFNLTPAEVYAAWAYYYDHKAEIDARIQADREAADQLLADPAYQAEIAGLRNQGRNE